MTLGLFARTKVCVCDSVNNNIYTHVLTLLDRRLVKREVIMERGVILEIWRKKEYSILAIS